MSKVATRTNFEEALKKKPTILHLSCHGVRNTVNTMGCNFNQVAHEGHFLLFENVYGDGELVSA